MKNDRNTSNNPVAVYDFTIPLEDKDGNVRSKEDIINFAKEYCKAWCFQLECGDETGYKHYQGRMSLKTKKRLSTMIELVGNKLKGTHVSCTATQNMGNDFYCTKEETRLEGPWSDKDIELKIPRHLAVEPVWFPWQRRIIDNLNNYEERQVNIIVDKCGNMGKSFLASWLSVRRLARRIPVMNDSKDIMRMIMGTPKVNCYFVDMPRAASKKNLHNFYAAIEDVKNGYCWDDRYSWKEEYFDPPQVWVFTNSPPEKELLSMDRWRLWQLDAYRNLQPLRIDGTTEI